MLSLLQRGSRTTLQRMDAYNAYFLLQKEMEPEIVQKFAPFSQVLDRIGVLLAEIDCLASFHMFLQVLLERQIIQWCGSGLDQRYLRLARCA